MAEINFAAPLAEPEAPEPEIAEVPAVQEPPNSPMPRASGRD